MGDDPDGKATAIHFRILAEKAEESLERVQTAREIAERAHRLQIARIPVPPPKS